MITDALLAEITRRHALGVSIASLAAEYRMPRKLVRRILREHAAGMEPPGPGEGGTP